MHVEHVGMADVIGAARVVVSEAARVEKAVAPRSAGGALARRAPEAPSELRAR